MLHYSPSGSNKYINVHFTDGYQVLSVLGLGRYGFHHIYIQMSGVYGVEIYDPKVTTLFSWFPDGQTERKPIVEIIDNYNAKIYMSYNWDSMLLFGYQYISRVDKKIELSIVNPS